MNIADDTTLLDQLDDLATGQIGPIAAWRLRWQIARDPSLAREWAAIRGLRSNLRVFSAADANRRLPITRPPTYTIGGFTMKRRTAALAASGVLLFSVTGAVAERYFDRPDAETDLTIQGWKVDDWNFRGQFRGNITLYDPHGFRRKTAQLEGSSPGGVVHVTYARRGRTLAQATVKGLGRFDVRGHSGNLYGSVVLSPLTAKDENAIAASTDEMLQDFLAFYRKPSRVTPSDAKRGFGAVTSLPGLVGGVFFHDFVHEDDMIGDIAGASWKVYGDVRVKAIYYDKKRTETIPGNKMWNAATGKLISDTSFSVRLPAKTLVQAASSKPPFQEDQLSELAPAQKAELAAAYMPRTIPVCNWVLSDPAAGIDHNTGEWKRVLRAGTFTGYGRHTVNDEKGKPVMVLDVTPLTPAKPAR